MLTTGMDQVNRVLIGEREGGSLRGSVVNSNIQHDKGQAVKADVKQLFISYTLDAFISFSDHVEVQTIIHVQWTISSHLLK